MQKQTSSLTSISLAQREPEEQELELPMMLEARKRAPSLCSEDDAPSPSALSDHTPRRVEPVCKATFYPFFTAFHQSTVLPLIVARLFATTWHYILHNALNIFTCHAHSWVVQCMQPADNRGFFTKLLHFCIGNWEKALVLGIIITLIVLVSVKVSLSLPCTSSIAAGCITC